MVVLLLGSGILPTILVKLGLMDAYREDEVDEGLGTYNACLSSKTRRAWVIEETHFRKKFGGISVNHYFFDKLKTPTERDQQKSKRIKSTPNYEIVSNPKYADAFQYTEVELRDTQEEKENSDFVLRNLKLAYVSADMTEVSVHLQTD